MNWGPSSIFTRIGAFSILRLAAFAACAMTVGLGVLALWTKQSLDRGSDVYQFVDPIAIGLFILAFVCLLGGLLHKVKANRIALYQEGAILEADGKVETIPLESSPTLLQYKYWRPLPVHNR
jgi:hypothetical protein